MDIDKAVQAVNEKLKEVEQQGFHIVGNVTYLSHCPFGHRPTLEYIKIDPDPRAGEVYKQKGGSGLSLTAQAIKKFANALNVRWLPGTILPTSTETRIQYRSKATCKNTDGLWREVEKDYELDLEARADEQQVINEDKARLYLSGKIDSRELPKDWKDWAPKTWEEAKAWATEKTRVQMIEKRKHKLTIAQTGSQLRCVKELAQLKAVYSAQELQKPFVVLKMVFEPDPNHPMDRAFLLSQATGSVAQLYQPDRQGQAYLAQAPAPSVRDLPEPPTITEPTLEIPPGGMPDEESALEYEDPELRRAGEPAPLLAQSGAMPTDPPSRSEFNAELDFEACEKPQRLRILDDLIRDTGFDATRLQRPMYTFNDREQLDFFKHLVKLKREKPKAAANPWE